MSTSMLKPRMRMLVSLLASTYYFPWPSQAFILGIAGLACEEPSKAILLHVGGQVYNQFAAFRVKRWADCGIAKHLATQLVAGFTYG